MHRVAHPGHGVALVAHRGQQRRQQVGHPAGPQPGDEGEPAGDAVGVEGLTDPEHLFDGGGGADLATQRVEHAPEELDVGPVELAGALADPQHVGRAVVPLAGEGVLAGQGLLVVEHQRLVAGEQLHLLDLGRHRAGDAAGGHEPQGPVDLVGHGPVALVGRAGGHELPVPARHPGQVGVAAPGEGPQQVQRGRGPVVGGQQPAGVVGPLGVGEADVVDHVAQKRREFGAAHRLGGAGAGLGELPGDPAHLHHRHAARVGQHDGHLQDHPQPVPDGVGRGVEGLGAVAGLQHDGLPGRHPAQVLGQRPGLAGEHQRRQVAQGLGHLVALGRIGPGRLVEGRPGPPGLRRPVRGGHGSGLRPRRRSRPG